MIEHLLTAAHGLAAASLAVVVGKDGERIRSFIRQSHPKAQILEQKFPGGSGDAVRTALPWLRRKPGDVLVLCGDVPLLTSETLSQFVSLHRASGHAATLLYSVFQDPSGYGRLVRNGTGDVQRIVEEKDADGVERKIQEVNGGVYLFNVRRLEGALGEIKSDNVKGEYYLTDAIHLLHRKGHRTGAVFAASEEILGVNQRADLARAESVIQRRILEKLMREGVTILDPGAAYVEAGVRVGRDSILLPNVMLSGKTSIGRNCRIGPNAFIQDSRIADFVEVRASFIYDSRVLKGVKIGPFAHIRGGAVIHEGARVGNFTEIKKSRVGSGAKVAHLSYIGDAIVGKEVNIGAGVITCNYDGRKKHRTKIRDFAFVGSNVNLVAPISVGKNAVVGAGSTVTENVPAGALALARARQVNKPNYRK